MKIKPGYFSSVFRNIVNKTSRKLIGNGRLQKKLSVMYYNLKALIDTSPKVMDEVLNYEIIINGRKMFYNPEYYKSNGSYGIAHTLRIFSGYNHAINACIEHGLYWGNFYFEHEVKKSGLNGVITFGEKRLEVLNKVADVPVQTVGPYIFYATCMLSDSEISKIKAKNGKTLLVFPTHSSDRVKLIYDQEELISKIKCISEKHNFQKVMICLYFKDIINGKHNSYLDNGFDVYTAGYGTDPNFLNRLKTLITLSDFTMSNDVGTHVGYCITLGKPHMIINQTLNYEPQSQIDMENIAKTRDIIEDKNVFINAFSIYTEEITLEQKELVERYWGTDCIKSKQELYSILKKYEFISNNGKIT